MAGVFVGAGRLNGELTIKAEDEASWLFPNIYGRVRCQDTAFHFWDAVDDFSQAGLELLFEGQRLYLHNSRGRFGAIPLTVTGALANGAAESRCYDMWCSLGPFWWMAVVVV